MQGTIFAHLFDDLSESLVFRHILQLSFHLRLHIARLPVQGISPLTRIQESLPGFLHLPEEADPAGCQVHQGRHIHEEDEAEDGHACVADLPLVLWPNRATNYEE